MCLVKSIIFSYAADPVYHWTRGIPTRLPSKIIQSIDSENQEDFKAHLMLLLKGPPVSVQKYKNSYSRYDTTEDNIFHRYEIILVMEIFKK